MRFDHIQTIVTHDNCADGLASAILARDAFFGLDVEILFIQHNTEEHKALTPRPNVLFADFVPYAETAIDPETKKRVLTEAGRAQVQAWIDANAIVLDHHKSPKESGLIDMFLERGQAIFGDEKVNPGVCGATLVYEHVWRSRRSDLTIQSMFAERFANLAGIRDTFLKRHPFFQEASLQAEVLHFYPRERWLGMTLTEIASRWQKEFRPVGEILMERQAKSVEKVAEGGYRLTTARGTRIVMFDALKKSTDVAEFLDKEADLVIGFCYMTGESEGNGQYTKLICSTRSHTGYNCMGLASYYGGGGHTAAAGFNVVLTPRCPQPFEHIRQLVEAYEATLSE